MTELLAPAGSVEALKSAVNAGCDAVYIGGKMFGARAYADNPDRDELLGAIDHCHIFDKKIYLTVNTLLKNEELQEYLYNFLRPYYNEGLDGVIVSDIGVMKAVSVLFPHLPIHISTQASITAAEGAQILKDLSEHITRVVPARELSIEEIELFKKKTDLEVEVFVHGAMCVSYSGQCLMSSIAGGRSGNRGRCAQPCRKNYDTGINDSFILSCKDMCTIPAIGKLMRAGVDSFKIEGRMKSPVYVAATVAAYRKYMDVFVEHPDDYEDYLGKHKSELEKDIDNLREIYNRGGFCTGFLLGEKKLISFDKASHNGVQVGKVSRVSGREATITYDKDINPGDVLEIRRDDGSALYEYTSGKGFPVYSTYGILVSKGQKAAVGLRVFRVKNNKVINTITESFIDNSVKRKVALSFDAHLNSPISLNIRLIDSDIKVTVCSGSPQEAKTSSVDEENIKKHLCKTGDSYFEVIEACISIDDGLFIPVGLLNTLRREALYELSEKLINRYIRTDDDSEDNITDPISGKINIDALCAESGNNELVDKEPEVHALITFKDSIRPVLENKNVKRIYCPLGSLEDMESCVKGIVCLSEDLKKEGRELYVSLPYICREKTLRTLEKSGVIDRLSGCCGFLIRNNEELSLFKGKDVSRIILDHSMHIFNRVSADCYGLDYTYSPELNKEELLSFGSKKGEMIVYGRLPLMITAHCVYRNEGLECLSGKCENIQVENFLKLKDGKGYVFPVIRRCGYCTNLIMNSSILNLSELKTEINEIGPKSVRFEFTTETNDEIRKVLNGSPSDGYEYTFGHFKRGVL